MNIVEDTFDTELNNLMLKRLDNNMKGIEIGLESIDQLFKLSDSLKNNYSLYIPQPVMRTVSITLEGIEKLHKLENVITISLEDSEPTSIFEKIIQVIRDVWKKIVETFEYIWNTISDFFTNSKPNSKKLNNKITDIRENKFKLIKDRVKTIDYKVSDEFEIKNNSLVQPLNYRNTQITSAVYFKEISDLEYLSEAIVKLATAILNGYKGLEHMSEVVNTKTYVEYNSVYKSFFKYILEYSNSVKNVFKTGNFKDKIDVLESLINYDIATIDTKNMFVADGFINGGMFYIYSINTDENEPITECLAISKINDSSKQSKLYYINPNDLDSLLKELEHLTKDNIELEDVLNNKYKEIRSIHKSIKTDIDKMINSNNITSEYDPEEFKQRFNLLRQVTQSAMKFVLDGSKAYGMFSDSVLYFTRLSEANIDFYIKRLNKAQ